MTVFDYQDYKKFVNDWMATQPASGRGQLKKMAEHLRVSSVIMSQVFRGPRELSLEQAAGASVFLGLGELERDYFLGLVSYERAGTAELKSVYHRQNENIRGRAQSLQNRIKHQALTEEDRATFYSEWFYSAIRLGSSIPGLGSVTALANHLKLDRALVAKAVDFLLRNGLLVRKGGQLELGPRVTHVGHDSPFVNRHHSNWRILGLQKLPATKPDDLFYTGPMALSKEAAAEIRAGLVELIERATAKAAQSKSEALRCLTIDWFGLE